MKFATRILLLVAVLGSAIANTGVEDRLTDEPTQAVDATPEPTAADDVTPEPTAADDGTQEPTTTTAVSDAPSDVPSAAPTLIAGTEAPTAALDCDGSTDTVQTCFADELNGGSDCDTCVAAVIQDLDIAGGGVTCDDYESAVCDALASCPCGVCVGDLQDFLNCNVGPSVGCTLSCSQPTTPTAATTTSEPTPAPSAEVAVPTILPTATGDACAGSTETLQTCFVDELAGGTDCDKCVATVLEGLQGLDGSQAVDCDAYETGVCGALSSCPCGGCVDVLQDYLNCNVGSTIGCTLSCLDQTTAPAPTAAETDAPTSSGGTPAPTSCSDSTSTLQTCFADELGGSSDCDKCVATVLQDIGAVGSDPFDLTCDEYNSQVCAAISSCPCGACADDVQTFVNCNVGPNIGCQLHCSDAPGNATCPVTEDSLVQCFASEVFEPTCGSCLQVLAGNFSDLAGINATDLIAGGTGNISDALGGGLADLAANFNCSIYQETACLLLSACDCGTCFDDLGTFLDCNIGAATGCFLNCDDGTTAAPSAAVVSEAPVASPSCAQVERDAITCLANAGDTGSECDSCVATSIPSGITECDALQEGVCSAIAGCPCDDCSSLVEQYLSCTLEKSVGCAVSC